MEKNKCFVFKFIVAKPEHRYQILFLNLFPQVVGQNLQTLEVAEEKTFQREEKLQVETQG